MILLLLADDSLVEISQGYDVVHKPGCILCVDELDAPIASFLAEEVLAYTLNGEIATRMSDSSTPNDELFLQPVEVKRRRLPRGRAAHMHRICEDDAEKAS